MPISAAINTADKPTNKSTARTTDNPFKGSKDAKEEVYIYDEVPTHARAIATNRKGHRAASYRDRHFGGDG